MLEGKERGRGVSGGGVGNGVEREREVERSGTREKKEVGERGRGVEVEMRRGREEGWMKGV